MNRVLWENVPAEVSNCRLVVVICLAYQCLYLINKMEPSKKTIKKTFSVPTMKGDADRLVSSGDKSSTETEKGMGKRGPDIKDKRSSSQKGKGTRKTESGVKNTKTSSQTGIETEGKDSGFKDMKETKGTEKKESGVTDKKERKKMEKKESGVTDKKNMKSTTARGVKEGEGKKRFSSSKLTQRSLTDAEYAEIFKAVIDGAEAQQTDSDVYTAPTQRDSQTEKEPPANSNTASVKHCGHHSDFALSHKENSPTNKKASGEAFSADHSSDDADKEIKKKPTQKKKKAVRDSGNSKSKNKNEDNCDDDTAVAVCEENAKDAGVVSKKAKKKKKEKNKDTLDRSRQCDDRDDQSKEDATIKQQRTKKERKNSSRGDEPGKVKKDSDAVAAHRDKTKRDSLHVTEDEEIVTFTGGEHEIQTTQSRRDHFVDTEDMKDEVVSEKGKKEKKGETENKKKNEVDCEKEKKLEEAECNFGAEDKILPKEVKKEEKGSGDESEKNGAMLKAEENGGMVKEEDKNIEADSVGSERSLDSSLLNLAPEVDQWDRLGEVQDTNENTPRISELVAATKTHTHKQKKKKNRENQLVPRKLSFGGKTASRKKRQQESDSPASRKKQHVQESDSDDESIPAELGTWVQCEAKGCQKWRYLPDVHDPVDLPPHWVCFMNKDERYNSCDAPEQEYDESEHILTQYTLGSVVWAKIDGFPWWPAMVDTDPDSDMYCLITHEDIMAPTEYHVVFLDEAVTRSWVRKDRIQHLTVNHFSPGSMFMKGHKYKREMQVAVRRAELALHMSLQDRLNRFGFSACFRNIKTKWTKADASTRKPQKRKPARKHGSASGAAASKKSRLVADRQQTEDSSDSDSCASNRSSQSSSPDDGDNDDSDDDDSQYEEANKKKRLVDRQKGKAKLDSHKGGRVVKGLPKSGGKTVEHKKAEKKGLDGSKSKKKFRAYVYSACVSHKVSSVKAQGHQRERKDYSTDSDSSHSVSSDEGCRKLTKAAKPLKKKFKSAESKSEEKKNTHKKSSLKSEGRKPEDSWKEGEKICKKNPSESDSDVDQLQKTQHPHKKKRLFKSEMAKKRDENLKKKKATASLEDKKIKTKTQKFVAPVKPEKSFPQKSSSDPTALIQAATSRGSDEEALHKPDHWGPKGSDPEMSAVPKQDQLPGPDQAADQRPTTTQENLTPHKSSPLNQDQFVPSMDMSHNDNSDEDDDKTAFMEDAADRKWKSGRGVEAQRRGKGRREEGDTDSDCLDLEEDLPIPSLEQVLQVPSKGASDRDSVMSDPLEMVED